MQFFHDSLTVPTLWSCKYGRLNGSLSLVCKSPDPSKAEEENEGEEAGEEEGGESNKQMESRQAQHENENKRMAVEKRGVLFWSRRCEPCHLPHSHPRPRSPYVLTCWSTHASPSSSRGWALNTRGLPSTFWEAMFLQGGDRSLLLEVQETKGMYCGSVGLSSKVGWDIKIWGQGYV